MVQITFVREKKTICVEEGTTVLDAQIRAGLDPDAPCGGAGTCGKCLVKIDGKTVRACQTKADRDLEVDTLDRQEDNVILTDSFVRPMRFDPDLAVHPVHLEKPQPGEKRSEWARLKAELARVSGEDFAAVRPDLSIASGLYQKRNLTGDWYAVHTSDAVLDLRREKGRIYFAAFDIGTTTVAGYLMDAETGLQLSVTSRMNPQAQYGADVISRANYVMEHGTEDMSGCIRRAVNEMLKDLAAKADADPGDVYQLCVVGNTCMHHLFLGISPASLVLAPYTPAVSEGLTLRAADYGFDANPNAQLLMLPCIAGYVGADTCGCLLTVRPDQQEEISLMLDIGTNGEMVLGNKERLVACSTAAGPAFEGAKISCGMRGAAGAVDHVFYKDGVFSYTTIEQKPAVGLCGSGLIDLVACLLEAGYLDETGRWTEEAQASSNLQADKFVLVPPEEAGNETGVYLAGKDVGEVQLAKAAIAAGIQLLMRELSITEEQIAKVYIAGAFGSYMNSDSAAAIGIFPRSLSKRVQPVGNAAGEGAKIALVNREERRNADALVKNVDFIELAASPDFQDCFVEELLFA